MPILAESDIRSAIAALSTQMRELRPDELAELEMLEMELEEATFNKY